MSQKIYTNLDIKGNATIGDITNATSDTDKFLVSDAGVVKYRTGSEMLSDLGVAPGVASNVQHQVKAGVAINKGQAVYVTSADGTNMIVELASNTAEVTSSKTMGLLGSTVPINGFANVIAEGLLDGLNTSSANAGDPVWLGTGGNLIYGLANKPYAPAHLVFIGIVTRVNANNGEIFVKVQNGFELDELHDVDLKSSAPVGNQILAFEGAPVNLWKNKTIPSVLGYTPVPTTITITINGSTQDLSANRIFSIDTGVTSFNTRTGAITLSSVDVTGALGYTPYNASNPAGYISSYTETDPTVPSHVKAITTTNISNWNTAFSWGNHSGLYMTQGQTRTDINSINNGGNRYDPSVNNPTNEHYAVLTYGNGGNVTGQLATHFVNGNLYSRGYNSTWSSWRRYWNDTDFTNSNISNWNTAFGWGNHASAGYVPGARTITINGTSYDLSANRSWTVSASETDTLATVTARGAITSTLSYFTGGLGVDAGQLKFNQNGVRSWNVQASGGALNFTSGDGAGNFIFGANVQAPIFYDSNNTGYYLDPSTYSLIKQLSIGSSNTSFSLYNNGSSYFNGAVEIDDALTVAGITTQNAGKYVRDSYYRTISGNSNLYGSGDEGWYTAATVTLTSNCSGAVLYGTLYDHRYNGADAYQIAIVARAECSFTSNNEDHYVDVGCTILGSTNYTNYRSKIRVVLTASSTNSRTYQLQFFETAWNNDTWQIEQANGWTVYSTPQTANSAVGTPRVNYISNQNADHQRANTSMFSPIYYDSNNTGYYLDPNSTSNLSTLKVVNATGGASLIVGTDSLSRVYDDSPRKQLVVNADYYPCIYVNALANNGNTTHGAVISMSGNLNSGGYRRWGMGIANTDPGIFSIGYADNNSNPHYGVGGSGWSQFWVDTSGNTFSTGSTRSPIFYDSDNTGYYVDPASTSNCNVVNTAGYSNANYGYRVFRNIGSLASWQEGYHQLTLVNSDAGYVTLNFHRAGYTSNNIYYNGNFYVDAFFESTASHRAPIFYDSNNTAYYFDGSSTGDSIRVAGDIVAYYSDERLKDRKGNIENALEKVLSLNGFYYTPNAKAQELGYEYKEEVGVSAQEVEAILPEIIKNAPIGQGYKTLNYGKLTPLLIEAIKEQNTELNNLKAELLELKQLVNKLINK